MREAQRGRGAGVAICSAPYAEHGQQTACRRLGKQLESEPFFYFYDRPMLLQEDNSNYSRFTKKLHFYYTAVLYIYILLNYR